MRAIFILALCALCSCGQPTSTKMTNYGIQGSQRFKVARVDVFDDQLAYNGQRGIYVITDTETGVEYVGVSGIGISELGSHQAGKTRVSDER